MSDAIVSHYRTVHWRSLAAWSLAALMTVLPAATPAPAAAADGDSHVVQIDDIRVHYLDFGHGNPVVLLHGAFGSTELWEPAGRQLAACNRVIIPDLRGRGRTTDGEGPLTSGRVARDTVALLDRLGIAKAHVVGHSMASMVVLTMLVDYPDRLASATLVGSPALLLDKPNEPLAALRADMQRLQRGETPGDPVLVAFRDRWRSAAADPSRFEIVVGKMLDATATNYPAAAARGRAPIMVVRTGKDELIPAEQFTALASLLDARSIVDYPDGNHVVMLQYPARMAADIAAFAARTDGVNCKTSTP